MAKKLTVMLSDDVYAGLKRVAGPRGIGRYLDELARRHVTARHLEAAYREMAQDEARETEALGWAEGLVGDVANDPR